ncbi:hypothetical protein KIN20_011531 [Parelaphostrongylus tenuis]|uniref:Uncharacterized protein n=1 Tax=Parelaphostrongylus tenuis TaxID=148309 RepID=A0AAD5QMI8_PARTN|nr:hypothetical protein KIN20_011531 [Parelaphostrongylus tenuis]
MHLRMSSGAQELDLRKELELCSLVADSMTSSLSNSLSEALSSTSSASDVDSIIEEIEATISIAVLDRKLKKKVKLFSSGKTDAARTYDRMQDCRNKFEETSNALQKRLSEQEGVIAERCKEIEALKDSKNKLSMKAEKLSARIEKLREKYDLMRTVLEVYTGFHRVSNERVAIKVESLTTSIPLLRNEAICLQYLNSRHNPYDDETREPIVRCLKYGKTDKLKYLVMDHCGPNVRQLKKATPKDKFRVQLSLLLQTGTNYVTVFKFQHDYVSVDYGEDGLCSTVHSFTRMVA